MWAAAALLLAATGAWSAVSPTTAGEGANLVVAGAGWPGIELGYERGLTPRFDLGARVSYHYGYEGLFTRLDGMRLQGVFRFLLAAGEKVSLGLTLSPGLLLYVPGPLLVGLTAPVMLTFGVPIDRGVTLSLSAELPFWYRFGPGGGLIVPLLLGFGVEVQVASNVSIWVRGRGGPTFFSYAARPSPTLDAKLGVAFRF